MNKFQLKRDSDSADSVEVPLRGRELLFDPIYNKGTAFTREERAAFDLEGMLPATISNLDSQVKRAYEHIVRKTDALEQYIGMSSLQDRNEVLYYKLLGDHLEEFLPIVYTPTVGEACKQYSHIFRRGRGLWITPDHAGRIADVLEHAPFDDVRLIVATDAERILGLGDLGAGGMGIPIGKLALYTSGAGIHPTHTLPVCLDVGTDNEDLLNDPLYVGWPHKRLRGERYESLVEEFVEAVKQRWPQALVQWEDFKKNNAFHILDRYQDRILSFNDDIQGTASVTLAGMYAACRVTRIPMEKHRVVILGAGAAGVGIARQLRAAMERAGLEGDDLIRSIGLLDSQGFLMESVEIPDQHKREFAWPTRVAEDAGLDTSQHQYLLEVVKALKPTMLIGTSGQAGIFTEEVIRAMAEHCDRPVVVPISNPTANAEAKPADIIRWTDGRAVVATGSPFEAFEYKGKTYKFSQGNNVYIFPGVGLGAIAVEAQKVTDKLFTVAAETLAELLPDDYIEQALLYPALADLRSISRAIAKAVGKAAVAEGLAPKRSDAEIEERVDAEMWEPAYPVFKPV